MKSREIIDKFADEQSLTGDPDALVIYLCTFIDLEGMSDKLDHFLQEMGC